MKKKLKKGIIVRFLVLLLALLLIISSSSLNILIGDEMSYIYSAFVGNKSEYQGVIELWNIDSFEAGIGSKLSYLQKCASRFQKEKKGAYVVIRNLSEGECINLMKGGVFPDLISCSYGVSESFKQYFSSYSNNTYDIDAKFLQAGINKNGDIVGLAWCYGCYYLISTQAKLDKVKEKQDACGLNEIAFDSEYEYKAGKRVKISKSIVYGEGDYLMPKNALIAYNKARSIPTENSTQSELAMKSQYSAYSAFLANDATILLGTQRDIWRMKAREDNGKVSNVIYLPLSNWTDLVQYVFVLRTSEGNRRLCAENFAGSLVSAENQKEIEKIGMFSVRELNETLSEGAMLDITPNNISDLELKPLFE